MKSAIKSDCVIPFSHRKKPVWPSSFPDFEFWGEDVEWIMHYDTVLTHPGGKSRGCLCNIHFPYSDSKESKRPKSPMSTVTDSKESKRPKSPVSLLAAGALDESTFRSAFEDVPTIPIYNAVDVRDTMKSITKRLSSADEDWERRVDAFKRLRSVILANGNHYPEFFDCLKKLEIPVMESLKDLRSQVVREACITIAFLAEHLKSKFNYFSEILFPSIVTLIQNSAKVMSSSAVTALRFTVEYTCSTRVLTLMVNSLSSKSKDIRRAICDVLSLVFHHWPKSLLDKRHAEIKTALKKGIEDADSEARVLARKAFLAYRLKFPERADDVLKSVSLMYQKTLSDCGGSSSSLHLSKVPKSQRPPIGEMPFNRSSSAIDSHSVQRSKARAQYAVLSRCKAGSNNSLTSKMAYSTAASSSNNATPEKEHTRSRTRTPRYSRSQPSSRSASPSSQLSYHTYQVTDSLRRPSLDRGTGIPRPRSTASSRESSPTRLGAIPKNRRLLNALDRPPLSTRSFHQRSYDEIEGPKSMSGDRSPDESETSSISSDKTSPYHFSRSNSLSNVQEILISLGKPSWNDRKEGLLSLNQYLNKYSLCHDELRCVTDTLTKMFMDSQIKVYTIFLGTLRKLISRHKDDLNYWLYVLLNRLFTKIGTDLLYTIEIEIQSILTLIRGSFPHENQLIEAFRLIVDPAQTYSTRVKIAIVSYLSDVIYWMSASEFNPGAAGKDSTVAVLSKLIKWIDIPEVKPNVQECLIALYNLNTHFMTNKISELKKDEQDIYFNLVHSTMQRSASASGTTSPTTLGLSSLNLRSTASHHSEPTDTDDIYKSLRKTTAEIQSYAFDRLQERNYSSQDSGICQLSPGSQDRETVDECLTGRNIEGNGEPSGHSSHSDSSNGQNIINIATGKTGEEEVIAYTKLPEVWAKIFETIQSDETSIEKRCKTIFLLNRFITVAESDIVVGQFKKIIKIIVQFLPCLDDKVNTSSEMEQHLMELVLRCLYKLLNKPGTKPLFAEYTELLIMKVVKISENRNHARCILLHSDAIIPTMGGVFPLLPTLKIFHTFAFAEVSFVAYYAIQGIQELIKNCDKSEFEPHIESTMKCLSMAINSEYSAVRKAVVFCIVEMHRSFGMDVMGRYLESFDPSKRRLIDVYIQRQNKDKDKD